MRDGRLVARMGRGWGKGGGVGRGRRGCFFASLVLVMLVNVNSLVRCLNSLVSFQVP